MQNITSSTVYLLPKPYEKLTPFCQWIVHTHNEHIPPLCLHLRNLTQYGGREPETSSMTHRHHSLYGDAIEHSFATGSGVIGTLGLVLLILVLIALISCFKEHRRIQVLPNHILNNIRLSTLHTTVSTTLGEQNQVGEENTANASDDSPPEYNTVINIQINEENPPTYIQAVEQLSIK